MVSFVKETPFLIRVMFDHLGTSGVVVIDAMFEGGGVDELQRDVNR